MTEAGTESAATKPGLGDLAEIFYAPRAVFARRTDGKFGLAYLGLVVCGIVIYFATRNLMQPVIDATIDQSMAQAAASGKATPEQLAASTSMVKTIASAGLIAFWIIAPFVVGLLVWIGGKIAKVSAIGRVAIMIATFSLFPRLVGSVIGAALAAMQPEGALSIAKVSLSPARFVDVAQHPALSGLLARFDLFILWSVVLTAIGVEVAARATKSQARMTAAIAWLIGSIPAIWGAIKAA